MSEPIIQVKNVSKAYHLDKATYSLRENFLGTVTKVLRQTSGEAEPQKFYALDDVSFDIHPKESVAIVGQNGSGKTTLIRLMANIMRPTSGQVRVDGRYAALISLGTGFIPSMSGRQNIYLNAAMYGVPPVEVDEVLDDIIAFADIGEFIEVPIKNYSSGMSARLGFSVASHILPDIVFVDEALGVGDVAFLEKCNRKINELVSNGATLVIVSHLAASVLQLCKRVIWLDKGKLMMDGDAAEVMQAYHEFMIGGGQPTA